MFGNITKDLVRKLLDRYYDGGASKVPTIDYLAPSLPPPLSSSPSRLKVVSPPTWLSALPTNSAIVRRSSYVDNPIRRLLAPRTGQKVDIHLEGATPTSIEVFGATWSYGRRSAGVGYVDFEQEDCHGNPVVAYVQHHGTAEGTVIYPSNDGYTMTDSATTTFTTPFSNQCHSNISKDFNLTHANLYFSNFASLPRAITHGIRTSAASRKYLESVVRKATPSEYEGQAIHTKYMEMTYNTMEKDDVVRILHYVNT
ncbi:hypothetical protein BDM02DRAFT_3187550 [Thelephora ganbajun]|uniref:Uncharacterized protein n=1 Tax=Thelephora ganbajun TaxID=370292 RepID=A0ACB6ZEC1_THEGA|nr:hypothetical protein BDM02DRAFT_3187550 [Thelephora ganbajun]